MQEDSSPKVDPRPIEVAGRPTKAYLPVAGAALLGSPIAGCILLASNFALFGQPDAKRQALMWGVVSTIAVFVLALFLPDSFPNAVLPTTYTVALQQIASRKQGAEIHSYLDSGGLKHSHLSVFAIGIACLALVLLLGLAILMALPPDFLGEDAA